jgi:hypothetical protein
MINGYHHPDYACSLAEFGEPFKIKNCEGWILKRFIPGFQYQDAMSCYPLFSCRDWSKLCLDLEEIANDLVTLTMVIDPFADADYRHLKNCFDIIRPFKSHYIVNLSKNWEDKIDRRHKQKIKKALNEIEIEVCHEPIRYIDEWAFLYDNLIQRHKIDGIRAFSKECFRKQLSIPGMFLIIGKLHKEIIGGNLVLMRDKVAYDHLAAFSPLSYQVNAAYGIFWNTFKFLAEQGIQYLDIGGVAGTEAGKKCGLDQFKRGWTKDTQQVYLCGRIFNSAVYEKICREKGISETVYFPAYRMEEF